VVILGRDLSVLLRSISIESDTSEDMTPGPDAPPGDGPPGEGSPGGFLIPIEVVIAVLDVLYNVYPSFNDTIFVLIHSDVGITIICCCNG
jgi:hypothetical protein